MQTWKESASLILAAKIGQKYLRAAIPGTFKYDYNLLCAKRHQKSSFVPGSYVFPGGAIHPADSSLKWNSLFSSFGIDTSHFSLTPSNEQIKRPRIFRQIPGELPRDISLRITAIRETFEEVGVLLCGTGAPTSSWTRYIELEKADLKEWRQRVHNDAGEFYLLCEHLKCYPDLWSLYEWSNWMTPTTNARRRFDNAFYLACLSDKPYAMHEAIEITDLKWANPRQFLESGEDVPLPPPQAYEIAKLARHESIENLMKFAVERNKKGVELNLPVLIRTKNARVHVYPGDSFYPEHVSIGEEQVIDMSDITAEELWDMSKSKHRFVMHEKQLTLRELRIDNYERTDGHLHPVDIRTINLTLQPKK